MRSRQWKREASEGGREREGFERGEVKRESSEARSRVRSEVERERERGVCDRGRESEGDEFEGRSRKRSHRIGLKKF